MLDHEYSIVGHSRARLGRYIGSFAALLSSLVATSVLGISKFFEKIGFDTASQWLLGIAIPAGIIFFICHFVFNRYGWKAFKKLTKTPDISGSWKCQGYRLDGDLEHLWEGRIVISQTWEKIRVYLKGPKSSSYSGSAALIPEPDGRCTLIYTYKNEVEVGAKNLNNHVGFSEIKFESDMETANGEYFTAKGRFSTGRLVLTKEKKHGL